MDRSMFQWLYDHLTIDIEGNKRALAQERNASESGDWTAKLESELRAYTIIARAISESGVLGLIPAEI